MRRLARFLRKPAADRRLLLVSAILYAIVAVAVRVLPFGRVRQLLARLGTIGSHPWPPGDAEARVVQAVRTVSALLPGSNCLADALVAQCLLARARCETTLCVGVARVRPADRPFDAHAWLERQGSGVIGARTIVYDPFRHPTRCVSSPSRR